MRRLGYEGVVVAAPVSVPYARFSTRTAHAFLGELLRTILARTGLAKARIDGLCVASFSLAPDSAVALTEHFGISARWVDHLPFGGASAILALHRAARAVQAGDAEIVACIAGDTNDPDAFRRSTAAFSRFGQDAAYPYGASGTNATVALLTDHYMRTYGVEAEDLGRICVAQRANAGPYPNALLRSAMTMEDYLASRPVAEPLRLFDCVMPCAGAEGFIVTTRETAEREGLPYANLLAVMERHNAYPDDPIQMRGGWAEGRDDLYAQAGMTPAAIDFAELYDDYPVVVAMQLEDLGFCDKGEAKAFLRAHDLTTAGSFPVNTCGGQLSAGQAGAAGGFLGIVEAVRQLTDTAEGAAVPKADIGLVTGFGMINYDRGLTAGAAILAR
ncbi:thiolase family protein [Acuticoccus sp. M5D2P5]|uniref:thiolase family protein n=1 Tax=Acuticoccus kalidii TaxID=2910977 RepID=UPI001F24C29D|nr:thiolase family protein [Acuticoccus kalidii]MCF3935487.1 thiolase family protein [Acuticoccus kalidii]